MEDDVNCWVAKCKDEKANLSGQSPVRVLPVGAPLDRLCVDVLGPFPETSQGNRYIL